MSDDLALGGQPSVLSKVRGTGRRSTHAKRSTITMELEGYRVVESEQMEAKSYRHRSRRTNPEPVEVSHSDGVLRPLKRCCNPSESALEKIKAVFAIICLELK